MEKRPLLKHEIYGLALLRQNNGEASTLLGLGLYLNGTPVLVHYLLGNCKTQPCSPRSLSGEQIFKNPFQEFFTHTFATVSDLQMHPGLSFIAAGHGNLAPTCVFRKSLDSVGHEI